MDTGLLAQFLIWLVLGGGAGAVTYGVWEKLEKWIPELAKLPSDLEGYITYALTAVLAIGAYLIQVWLGYADMPVSALEWAEAIFAVMAVALGVNRVIHGQKKKKACC